MSILFGTDGVRGIANSELTPELAFQLGKAGAHVLAKKAGKPTFLIGADTRISGDMLEKALSAGILAVGGNVMNVGIMPTPGVAYLVRHYQADAGVVISASHNPYEYNGIKFFNGEGFKLADSLEDEIEALLVRQIDTNSHFTGDRLGKYLAADETALDAYSRFLADSTPIDLSGRRIVLDCANGAAYQVAEKVYRSLGCEPIVIGNKPTGLNINVGCGSTHPEELANTVVENGAMAGMAFDGDADRLIAVDERGRILDGDRTLAICGAMMQRENRLPGNVVTATVMSNIGLHKYLESLGISVDVTKVGDRYVLERMQETGCTIGGEQSGHTIFLDKTTTGDGILTSLQLLKAILEGGGSLAELADQIPIYPQVLRNASVDSGLKNRFQNDPEIQEAIREAETELGDDGRVLIRPSGTEPLIRVMIEGQDIDQITAMAEKLKAGLEEKFGED